MGFSSVGTNKNGVILDRRERREAPVATAVFHSALKPRAPRILLIRYIRKLIVIRWSRVYRRKSERVNQ